MKRILILALVFFPLVSNKQEKTYAVKHTEADWVQRVLLIQRAKVLIEKSNAPYNEAAPILQDLSVMENEILTQVGKEKLEQHKADSISNRVKIEANKGIEKSKQ